MTAEPRRIDRVAIVGFHSHGDRSFLDDRDLALLSGDLAQEGVPNDLVLAAFGAGADADEATLARLAATLEPYDAIVFERIWDKRLVARLRDALPERTFVHARGEHALDDPPADYVCPLAPRHALPTLIAFLRGAARAPLDGTLCRRGDAWVPIGAPTLARPPAPRWAPNLRPLVVNPDGFPPSRTFSIVGNVGCPYQADARDNPVYAGVTMPPDIGRGCAFCTTGNRYVASPPAETAASVLAQLRYVRGAAPELSRIVLKDQNPLAYLGDVVRAAADERLGPFTLLLETRADWLTRNARRFDDALAAARDAGIRLSPFLVGIESFAQPELDRYNKGTTAEANVEFVERLWAWRERYGDTLDLASASFGFVLFSPWTTLDDLEANLRAIRRTRFDALRGRVLLSRARLYPDTALYWLAERDGLLIDAFREGEDASRRYGYYPAHPWRFLHDDVARFAELATALVERSSGRDEIAIFGALVEAFREADDFREVTEERVGAKVEAARATASAPDEIRRRFARLTRPLALDRGFADGFRLLALTAAPGLLRAHLGRPGEAPVELEIVPHGRGAAIARSRHYDMRCRTETLTAGQRSALTALCRAIEANDR